MRAIALKSGQIYIREDAPEPVPSSGQVLVKVRACGICGSDLHFAKHGARMLGLRAEMTGMSEQGAGDWPELDLDQDVWMGHEFSAEVLEAGPETVAPPAGTIVISVPELLTPTGIQTMFFSNTIAAGYGERMLLSAPLLVEVPNGLDPRHAALVEPMSVGLHAVNKAGITPADGALVLGCGPVGQAVIAALRLKGVDTIVAADFSPTRRALAATMGASEVVDPAVEASFAAWTRAGRGRPLVVFEAVGAPGMIETVLREAPKASRLVVVGVCMEQDRINPFFGVNKELNIQFVLAFEHTEFVEALRHVAEGDIDVAPLITAEVGLDGVADAFEALGSPDEHCKVVVTP